MPPRSRSAASRTTRIVGGVVAFATIAGAIAAIAVVPEVRCWLHLDSCLAIAPEKNPSLTQSGISNSGKIEVGQSASVLQTVNDSPPTVSGQMGVANTGSMIIKAT